MNQNTTAVLVRRTVTGRDSDGNDTYGPTYSVFPAVFWPDSTSESVDGREQQTWQSSVCLPASADVSGVDAVIPQATKAGDGWAGDRYEVDGPPQPWRSNPFTGDRPEYPVVLRLIRVTG